MPAVTHLKDNIQCLVVGLCLRAVLDERAGREAALQERVRADHAQLRAQRQPAQTAGTATQQGERTGDSNSGGAPIHPLIA
jgi:hypothetical protein